MSACHTLDASSTSSALDRLVLLFAELRSGKDVGEFSAFEADIRLLMAAVECEAVALALKTFDVDLPAIAVDGVVHRRAVRCEAAYMSRAGEVRVERSLYRASDSERCICPMELRAGVVDSWWTPGAASVAVWAVAHLTAQEAEDLFDRVGGMAPSRSSLDRLSKAAGERWEGQLALFEESLRQHEEVPAEAVSVSVSLDGVMVPMKDGDRQGKRAAALASGKETRGPAGFREAACGTITFLDAAGQRLTTRYLGRMPEKDKRTLKDSLEAELAAVVEKRPDLRVIGLADGAREYWTWFQRVLPQGSREILDYFHAAEHLQRALDSAHGEGTPEARAEFERLRVLLRDEPAGVDKIINALAYQRKKRPKRRTIAKELAYFRINRHRMAYAKAQADKLPIGSGVVEAANKTLVTVRMKRAGSRWTVEGGQAVLTFRALAKSGRFDRAWKTLAATHRMPVTTDDRHRTAA